MAGPVSAEAEIQERLSLLSTGSVEVEVEVEAEHHHGGGGSSSSSHHHHHRVGLLHLSDEVLLLILRQLDPMSLLRLGATCRTLFRVCSCNSLWTKHFQASFDVSLATPACSVPAKDYFRLVFMWKSLFDSLHSNRGLQEKLFANIPQPPPRYWTQWLALEESVPLPAVRLPAQHIHAIWGICDEALKKLEDKDDDSDIKFEWRKLRSLACEEHGGFSKFFHYVLNQQENEDHEDLETMFQEYAEHRFQWHFRHWLFKKPPPFNHQLRAIFLQWRKHKRRKVAKWGTQTCDVEYLSSLHPITEDYWNGRLAEGEETVGIQVMDNYFSMCKSLLAWLLGRDWGRLKRRKVYEDTLAGVYLVLRRELWEGLVDHQRFWEVAKSQMNRICTLEETAANYVNWKMIENLPYYKLYMVSGNPVYLCHLQDFLQRKRLVHNWIHLEENAWVRNLLTDDLYTVLEYHSKINQDGLHGDGVVAQLSRLIWLYLNSGQLLYLEAIKGLVLQYAQDCVSYLKGLCSPED